MLFMGEKLEDILERGIKLIKTDRDSARVYLGSCRDSLNEELKKPQPSYYIGYIHFIEQDYEAAERFMQPAVEVGKYSPLEAASMALGLAEAKYEISAAANRKGNPAFAKRKCTESYDLFKKAAVLFSDNPESEHNWLCPDYFKAMLGKGKSANRVSEFKTAYDSLSVLTGVIASAPANLISPFYLELARSEIGLRKYSEAALHLMEAQKSDHVDRLSQSERVKVIERARYIRAKLPA